MKADSHDIVVLGAGMAGVMAALAAKSAGNRVLIVEPSNVLGGQGTAGGVAGFCGDTDMVNDCFRELVQRLERHDLIRELNPLEDRRSYDLEWCAFFLQEMVAEQGIDVLLHSRAIGAEARDGRILSLTLSTAGGIERLSPRFVIDASGSCVMAALAGFPVVHEGANKQLPMSLYFTLWDTGRPVRPFLPPGCTRWENDDEIPMTSLHCFESGKVEVKMKVTGFDAADGLDISRAEIAARRQMTSLIHYLQTRGYHGKLLDRHVLASVSRQIGVREARRIEGEHILTVEEVTHGAVFEDAVAVGTYHLDYHWPDRMQRGDTGITTMVEPYHIPWRALIPRGAKNLLVPGRSASGDQLAMSSFRVMATVAQMGFAAGKAAGLCVAAGRDLQAIEIRELQSAIEAGGQRLDLSEYGSYLRNALCDREVVVGGDSTSCADEPPSIVLLRNNRILVAWSVCDPDDPGKRSIQVADRHACKWSKPRELLGNGAFRQPMLCHGGDGSVLLFLRKAEARRDPTLWISESADQGDTWSEPQPLVDTRSGRSVCFKGRPLRLADGGLVVAESVATAGGTQIFLLRSDDRGRTWRELQGEGQLHLSQDEKRHPVAEFPGEIADPGPMLWEAEAGRMHLLARTSGNRMHRADSVDGGRSWSSSYPAENDGLDGVVEIAGLATGAALVAGAVAAYGNGKPGFRLSASFDNGLTWPHAISLDADDPVPAGFAVASTPRGAAVVFASKNGRIDYWHGSVEQIIDADALEKHAESLHSGIMA